MRPPRYHVLTQEPLPAATGGYDENGAGVVIPSNRGLQLKNMLPGRSGRVVMRGPLVNGVAAATVGAFNPSNVKIGMWTFDDIIVVDANGVYGFLDMAALTWTSIGPPSATIGTRYARVDMNVYGTQPPGSFSTGRGPSHPGGNLIRWDGTKLAGGFSVYSTINSPYGGVIDVSSYLSRLFVLGGHVPGDVGTGPAYKDRLYWSDIGGPVTDTLALWEDDVTGLVNQIALDGGASDYGVGLAKTQAGLMILRRRSIDRLSGLTPANFAVKRVLSKGCRSTESIVEYDGGVFFMSDDGYTWFDGATARQVSDAVQPSLMAAVRANNTVVNASLIGTDSIQLNVVVMSGSFVSSTSWSGIYHIPSDSWTEFTSLALLNGNRPVWSGRTVNFPWVFDGRVFYDASFVTQPTAAAASLRGTETVPDTAVQSIIPAEMKTRVASLGLPVRTATLNRAYPQYILRTDVASNAGWAFTVEDSIGNVLVPSVTLPPQSNPSAPPQRQVGSLEALAETIEAVFHFTYQSSSLRAAYDAELHDSYVEFSFAEDKPS